MAMAGTQLPIPWATASRQGHVRSHPLGSGVTAGSDTTGSRDRDAMCRGQDARNRLEAVAERLERRGTKFRGHKVTFAPHLSGGPGALRGPSAIR